MTRAALKGVLAGVFCAPPVLRLYRKGSRRRPGGAVIVNFHRLHGERPGFLRKGPSVHTHVRDFERFLRLAARRFRFVALADLVAHLETGEPFGEDAIAITLDDGFADNHTLGLPILRRHSVPATVYLTTGYIGTDRLLPMDQVDRLLATTIRRALAWPPLGDAPLPLETAAQRREVNIRIGRLVKGMDPAEFDQAIAELADRLGTAPPDPEPAMLSWEQVRDLLEGGIHVGSHGVSHFRMTRLAHADAVAELRQSRDTIAARTGITPEHYAFPYGADEDFSDTLRAEAGRAGYRSVASIRRGINLPGATSPFGLMRCGLVGSPEETMLYLERFFHRVKEWPARGALSR